MSCELSHVRFSNYIKDSLYVVDDKKYYQGVTYPDSRTLTKIDRDKTHNIKYTKRTFFEGDDFKKGWASHVIYDIVHGKIIEEMFYDFFKMEDEENNRYSGIARLSIKILHDLEDSKTFDFNQYLPLVDYDFSPQGESISVLNRYNTLLYDSYKNSKCLCVNDYKKSLRKFKYNRGKNINSVIEKVIKFQENIEIRKKIESIYELSVERYEKDFLL